MSAPHAIPDDVLRLAKAEINKGEMAIVTVANAILAERERCAKVAVGFAERLAGLDQLTTAISIAERMRKGA
jgi:hypothetical protein